MQESGYNFRCSPDTTNLEEILPLTASRAEAGNLVASVLALSAVDSHTRALVSTLKHVRFVEHLYITAAHARSSLSLAAAPVLHTVTEAASERVTWLIVSLGKYLEESEREERTLRHYSESNLRASTPTTTTTSYGNDIDIGSEVDLSCSKSRLQQHLGRAQAQLANKMTAVRRMSRSKASAGELAVPVRPLDVGVGTDTGAGEGVGADGGAGLDPLRKRAVPAEWLLLLTEHGDGGCPARRRRKDDCSSSSSSSGSNISLCRSGSSAYTLQETPQLGQPSLASSADAATEGGGTNSNTATADNDDDTPKCAHTLTDSQQQQQQQQQVGTAASHACTRTETNRQLCGHEAITPHTVQGHGPGQGQVRLPLSERSQTASETGTSVPHSQCSQRSNVEVENCQSTALSESERSSQNEQLLNANAGGNSTNGEETRGQVAHSKGGHSYDAGGCSSDRNDKNALGMPASQSSQLCGSVLSSQEVPLSAPAPVLSAPNQSYLL